MLKATPIGSSTLQIPNGETGGTTPTPADLLMDAGKSPTAVLTENSAELANDKPQVVPLDVVQKMINDALKAAQMATEGQLREAKAEVARANMAAEAAKFFSLKIGGIGNPRAAEGDVEITTINGRLVAFCPIYLNRVPKPGPWYPVSCYENNVQLRNEHGQPVLAVRRDLIAGESFINESVDEIPVGLGTERRPFKVNATLKIHSRWKRRELRAGELKSLGLEKDRRFANAKFIDEPEALTGADVAEAIEKQDQRSNTLDPQQDGPGSPDMEQPPTPSTAQQESAARPAA